MKKKIVDMKSQIFLPIIFFTSKLNFLALK